MQVHPVQTGFPALDALLAEFGRGIVAALGDNLLALYLQGSLAVGGFDIHSDVDFLGVVKTDLTSAEMAAVQALHQRLYEIPIEWAKHLEGSYFPLAVLRDHGALGVELPYLDNGSLELERSTHCNTLVVRRSTYEHGIPLVGPRPTDLMVPVSDAELKTEIRETMRKWGATLLETGEAFKNRWHLGFIVLSYCRMLQTLATGRIHSKKEAANWGLANLDAQWLPLIVHVWADRPDPWNKVLQEADPTFAAQGGPFLRYALSLIE